MNEQFEFLPFMAGPGGAPQQEWGQEQEWEQGQELEWEDEGELEGERGRGGGARSFGGARGGGRAGFARGGRGAALGRGGRGGAMARTRPPSRMQPVKHGWAHLARHNWPRRRPPYGTYYGAGWPYSVVALEPEPYPVPFSIEPFPAQEPAGGPEPDNGNGAGMGAGPGDDAGPDEGQDSQGEVPPTLSDTLTRLPAAQRPAYQALGPIVTAMNAPQAAGAGLYLIEFTSNGRPRAYSGQSDDIRRRLQQHMLCAQMMGLSLAGHQVYVAPLPGLSAPQRRALEKRIHRDMLARHAGVLTNQRAELEMRMLGDAWR
jgi:hypothetical protein